MDKENISALYHRIMKRENFETAANDLFHLLVSAQKNCPNKPRFLYVDIDGHRNENGDFDEDMLELQQEFGLDFLLPFFKEIHFPLISVKNTKEQRNNIPAGLKILNARNEKNRSLDELYIENYCNTEFNSEKEVYEYLEKISRFLKKMDETLTCSRKEKQENYDEYGLLWLWYDYLKNIIIELFNNFLYGNLLSATAMTRTLIEGYVYFSILKKEKSANLLENWFFCSIITKTIKNKEHRGKKVFEEIERYCRMKKIDFQEICHKFDTKNANKWLSDVIPKSKITFHDACNYLNEPELYRDYQEACSFVHGQDITSKIMPFTFYSTIYAKMFIMMTYIFKTLRLFPIDEALQIEIQNLEEELWDLADFVE